MLVSVDGVRLVLLGSSQEISVSARAEMMIARMVWPFAKSSEGIGILDARWALGKRGWGVEWHKGARKEGHA